MPQADAEARGLLEVLAAGGAAGQGLAFGGLDLQRRPVDGRGEHKRGGIPERASRGASTPAATWSCYATTPRARREAARISGWRSRLPCRNAWKGCGKKGGRDLRKKRRLPATPRKRCKNWPSWPAPCTCLPAVSTLILSPVLMKRRHLNGSRRFPIFAGFEAVGGGGVLDARLRYPRP